MNYFRKLIISTVLITMMCMLFAFQAGAVAPGPKVSEESTFGNKHNLSVNAWTGGSYTGNNPNTYKATDSPDNPKGKQICIFCHTPHSANVEGGAPLWNRRFSTETFSRYSAQSTWMAIRHYAPAASAAQYGQPDGASKLCLSCHDGVASLGDVLNGGPIAMASPTPYITGIASFKPSVTGADKMKIGHHPVSFVYNDTVATEINNSPKGTSDWKWPISVPEAKLDQNSKMQCTTCHNPHQNQSYDDQCHDNPESPTSSVNCDAGHTRKVAPFWVKSWGGTVVQDRDNLCEGCHAVNRAWTDPALPWPQ